MEISYFIIIKFLILCIIFLTLNQMMWKKYNENIIQNQEVNNVLYSVTLPNYRRVTKDIISNNNDNIINNENITVKHNDDNLNSKEEKIYLEPVHIHKIDEQKGMELKYDRKNTINIETLNLKLRIDKLLANLCILLENFGMKEESTDMNNNDTNKNDITLKKRRPIINVVKKKKIDKREILTLALSTTVTLGTVAIGTYCMLKKKNNNKESSTKSRKWN